MNIKNAVEVAYTKDKCITLKEFRDVMKIKPTDSAGHCILMSADGSNPSKYGWQPSASDLMSTDWIVVD